MTFITVDSKLTIDGSFLNIQLVKHDSLKKYWFHSFLLLALFIGFQAYRAIYDKKSAWVWVFIGLGWIYPHMERIFRLLFVYTWRNRIRLDKISKAVVRPSDNDLETGLYLHLSNGRQKHMIFRNAENQLEDFLQALKTRKTELEVVNRNR